MNDHIKLVIEENAEIMQGKTRCLHDNLQMTTYDELQRYIHKQTILILSNKALGQMQRVNAISTNIFTSSSYGLDKVILITTSLMVEIAFEC